MNVKKYYPEKALASGITGGRNRIDILEWAKCNRGIISEIDLEILKKEQQRLSEQITAGIPEFANCAVDGANLICAPATSHSSSGNSNGKIHRDCSSTDDEGLLVVELLLDDIRLDNGTVKFWPKSIYVPCQAKNPSRHIAIMDSKDEYEYLVASAGDIMVWDARILHQSMSNSSRSPSVKLHWFIEGREERISQKGASVLEVDSGSAVSTFPPALRDKLP
jgi:ectoine hydroxylase-related dioxygenase (phytanoyl-CoA dioxygenase family)